jgi:hypothetical protein
MEKKQLFLQESSYLAVLPAYGLQDLRNRKPDPKPKANPNTMCQPSTLGENRGTGHFYFAKNRTFLLCVDTRVDKAWI